MLDPLATIRRLIQQPADAVRWACLLEAMAPKVGNVYPGQSFENLTHLDFVTAAEITACQLGRSDRRLSERMLASVSETVERTRTNVNLGIVLLLGPLVGADEVWIQSHSGDRSLRDWVDSTGRVLRAFDLSDGERIFQAIQRATAGGLGEVDSMDVHQTSGPVDLLEAMKLAAQRDRIALQYSSDFADLIDNVVPVVAESIVECGDLLGGISTAQLRLLAQAPDSLIARKNGLPVALAVQQHARDLDAQDTASIADLNRFLRSQAHTLNPGTTADLIAAALYVLLRTPFLLPRP